MSHSRTTRPIGLVLLGAALALVSVVAVDRAWPVTAAPGDVDTTFVPVTPCRLFDYRPGPASVGDRTSPLGPGEVETQQVTGGVGDCDGAASIPSTATGVAMNVTIAQPTAQSNLRLYPADAPSPLASNLNWLAGQSPTPNKVDVKLSPSGAVKIENFQGSVFVIGDVVGYYTNSSLQELAGDVAALQQRVAAIENSRSFAVQKREASGSDTGGSVEMAFVEVTAPADGHVVVNSTALASNNEDGAIVRCTISDSGGFDPEYEQAWTSPGGTQFLGAGGTLSGTRRFPIAAGVSATYSLVCNTLGPDSTYQDIVLTAIFTPAL